MSLIELRGRGRCGQSHDRTYAIGAGELLDGQGGGAGVFEYKIDFGSGYRRSAGMLESAQATKEAGDTIMPLTHDFKETIRARAQRDPNFRQALLREAVECILNGGLETGKAVLRDYVNATVGFQGLERRTQIPAKSLMRMLGPKGSPSVVNFSNILTALQKSEGVHFELSLRR